MAVSGGLRGHRLTVMTQKQRRCSNTVTVIGTATGAVFQTARNKLSITAKPENHFLTKAARMHALREAKYGVIEK